ncbi:hypothetical protein O163_06545 [Caldanaerobacter subterraneus subsp. yonseiensis KB-1]|uniref:Uncharacterized protein n=1 Tax=Caldanaerobacter subterraneus subsp. yonseiensis KB-1 TaxID=1388761 RepID=U5CW29_CALSX|nr:hypothetical protein O163_06545 [Caldanaerobacter subterraneus subsp. yonseiensis KB-1]
MFVFKLLYGLKNFSHNFPFIKAETYERQAQSLSFFIGSLSIVEVGIF